MCRSGIPYTALNTSIQPWNHLITHPGQNAARRDSAASCTGPIANPGQPYWYGQMTHNGLSSFNTHASTYPIFRDVTTSPYNADNTGASDASTAIQNAINGMRKPGLVLLYN